MVGGPLISVCAELSVIPVAIGLEIYLNLRMRGAVNVRYGNDEITIP